MSLSLIPYSSSEGREIVLRHRNAIVVRDPTSHRLDIRILTECPTCHQPLRPSAPHGGSPDRGFDNNHESYVDPNYFRMLRAGSYNDEREEQQRDGERSVRRYGAPILPRSVSRGSSVAMVEAEEETGGLQEGSSGEAGRIKKEAFSPNYFKTFFVEERVLGKGGKGVVLLVRHQIDGLTLGHFACKRVPVGNDHAWLEKVLIEVELLAKLSHPNLVSYRHVWLEDVQLSLFGPSVACAFILQQYCNGGDLLNHVVGSAPKMATKEELKARMRRRSRGESEMPTGREHLKLDEIYRLFRDVTAGLVYLHANGYIHRDLKPSNCLLHHDGGTAACLISDFGEVQLENAARKSTGSTGTISYCAPEVLRQDSTGRYGNFTTKSDIFSLGMILYFMCFKQLPYRNSNAIEEELEDIDLLRTEILTWEGFHEERRERPELPAQLYQLIGTLLALDPGKRPSAADVLAAIQDEAAGGAGPRVGVGVPMGFRRVQPLDTPSASGPATPDPTRRSTTPKPGTLPITGSNPFFPSTTLTSGRDYGELDSPRLRPNALALSRSQETFPPPHQRHSISDPSDVVATRALQRSPSRKPFQASSTSVSASPVTGRPPVPLLMAPPGQEPMRTPLGRLLDVIVAVNHLGDTAGSTLVGGLRWGIFVVKVLAVAGRCAPYGARVSALASVIGLAGMGLLLPMPMSMSMSMGRVASGRMREWSLGWEVLLVVLHQVVLWMLGGWGMICVVPEGPWGDVEVYSDTG